MPSAAAAAADSAPGDLGGAGGVTAAKRCRRTPAKAVGDGEDGDEDDETMDEMTSPAGVVTLGAVRVAASVVVESGDGFSLLLFTLAAEVVGATFLTGVTDTDGTVSDGAEPIVCCVCICAATVGNGVCGTGSCRTRFRSARILAIMNRLALLGT